MLPDSKNQDEAMRLLRQSSMFHACSEQALRKVGLPQNFKQPPQPEPRVARARLAAARAGCHCGCCTRSRECLPLLAGSATARAGGREGGV